MSDDTTREIRAVPPYTSGGGTPFLLGDLPDPEPESGRMFGWRALAAVALAFLMVGALFGAWLVRAVG